MKLFENLVVDYTPKLISVSLWIYFFLYQEYLLAAIGVTIYSFLLYFVSYYKKTKSFDGVIELTEDDRGSKKFQLIVNKDPETFQDQDQVIFQFKKVS